MERKRYHDQDNLLEEEFIGGLVLEGESITIKVRSESLRYKHEAEREETVLTESAVGFASDTLPLTRLHFLILPKWFYQLGTKCSSI